MNLGGLSLGEVGPERLTRLWLRGGFPRAFLADSYDAWTRWMDTFTATFVERDLPLLAGAPPAPALSRLWRMLAHYHGRTWNAAELARSVDSRPAAVNRYRDLLAGAFLLRVLPPWFENLGKRLVKSPKTYFRDSGILHHLLEIEDFAALALHPRYGASWEGFALEQTLAAHGERRAFYYRTQRGAELDLLLFRRGRRWGFEFQMHRRPEDHEVHACGGEGPRPRTPVRRVSGGRRVSAGRPDHRAPARPGRGPAPPSSRLSEAGRGPPPSRSVSINEPARPMNRAPAGGIRGYRLRSGP